MLLARVTEKERNEKMGGKNQTRTNEKRRKQKNDKGAEGRRTRAEGSKTSCSVRRRVASRRADGGRARRNPLIRERSFLVFAKRGLDSRSRRRDRENGLLVFPVVTVSRALNFPAALFSRATRALNRLEMKSARLETDPRCTAT